MQCVAASCWARSSIPLTCRTRWRPPGYTYGKGFLQEAQALDYKSACQSYSGPVLILHGDLDFIAPISYSYEAEKWFPDCTLQVVPGGFHGFYGWQEMKALNDMLDFFQNHMA